MRQRRNVGGLALDFEAPEAGRYMAPILVCPGLFQSLDCWRPLTSMLAHRGWELYFLSRGPDGDADSAGEAPGWQRSIDRVAHAAASLGDQVILFGADLGAVLALAALRETRAMALALFAPSRPLALTASVKRSTGFLDGRHAGAWQRPPRRIAKEARETCQAPEARILLEEASRSGFEIPDEHPPALVFVAEGDALVPADESALFAAGPYSEQARNRLAGRWWPAAGRAAVADEVHRYLILTLGDRVVEFPEEILADD